MAYTCSTTSMRPSATTLYCWITCSAIAVGAKKTPPAPKSGFGGWLAGLQEKADQIRREAEKKRAEEEARFAAEEEERIAREEEEAARAAEEKRVKDAEAKAEAEKRREERMEAARKQREREEEAEQRRLERKQGGASAGRSFERPVERSTESSGRPQLNLTSKTGGQPTWREREAMKARGELPPTAEPTRAAAPAAEEPAPLKKSGYVPPHLRGKTGGGEAPPEAPKAAERERPAGDREARPAPTDRWGSSRKPAAETARSESPAASSGGAYKPPGAGGAYRPPGRR